MTAKLLDAARVEAGRAEWADHQVKGLYFRISPASKAWCVRYRLKDGSQRRLPIGAYPEVSLAAARDRALIELAKISAGRDPAAEVRKDRREAKADRKAKPRTFGDLWSRYAAHASSGKRPGTTKYQAWLYHRHIEPQIGATPVAELDRATIRGAVREIGATVPVTANRAQALIAAVLNWAVAEELIPANPVAQMARLFEERSRERVLSDVELKVLWRALDAAPGRVDIAVSAAMAAALKLVLLTLSRGNEVAGLHAREIDVEGRSWTLPAARHKSRRTHVIPLCDDAWGLLEAVFGGDPHTWQGYAFPNRRHADAPMERHSMTRAMNRIVAAEKLPDATPHDLRRTAATLIASERVGAAPHVVSALLGHTPEGPAVTAIYNRHRYAPEKRRALQAWEALLGEIVSGVVRPSNVASLKSRSD